MHSVVSWITSGGQPQCRGWARDLLGLLRLPVLELTRLACRTEYNAPDRATGEKLLLRAHYRLHLGVKKHVLEECKQQHMKTDGRILKSEAVGALRRPGSSGEHSVAPSNGAELTYRAYI